MCCFFNPVRSPVTHTCAFSKRKTLVVVCWLTVPALTNSRFAIPKKGTAGRVAVLLHIKLHKCIFSQDWHVFILQPVRSEDTQLSTGLML